MDFAISGSYFDRNACVAAGGTVGARGGQYMCVGAQHLLEATDYAATIPAWYKYVSWAGAASGAFHGYKRHRGSIGWALGWAFCGSIAPIITIPLSLAEGYGKPAGSK